MFCSVVLCQVSLFFFSYNNKLIIINMDYIKVEIVIILFYLLEKYNNIKLLLLPLVSNRFRQFKHENLHFHCENIAMTNKNTLLEISYICIRILDTTFSYLTLLSSKPFFVAPNVSRWVIYAAFVSRIL